MTRSVLRLSARTPSGTRYWSVIGAPVTLWVTKYRHERAHWWISMELPGNEAVYADLPRDEARKLLKRVRRRHAVKRRAA